MPSPSKLSDAATIARAVLGYAPPPSYGAVRRMREAVPTAEFDALTGDVVARGRRYARYGIPESQREIDAAAAYGREVMGRDDVVGAYRPGAGAAYPKGDRDTRRHELFHGMVGDEFSQPDYMRGTWPQEIPSVAAITAARKLAGKNRFLLGAADLAEELTAQSVGLGRPLTSREALYIAGIYGDKRSGWEAMPFRIVEYGLAPVAEPHLAGAAILTGVGAGAGAAYAIPRMFPGQEQRQDSGMTADELIAILGQQ